jgi:hypothetical protein
MERRLVLRILDYWRGITHTGAFPAESDIDPGAMSDMWPWCAVLGVDGKETDPEFSYIGDHLKEWCGANLTGKPLSATPRGTLVEKAFSHFDRVLEKKVPISVGGQFTDHQGVTMLYRSILLPLADDGKTVVALLGATNCGEVSKD